jgi:hypothetical protein
MDKILVWSFISGGYQEKNIVALRPTKQKNYCAGKKCWTKRKIAAACFNLRYSLQWT